MTPSMVMCRDCGHFQPAKVVDGERVPIQSTCERCGGTEFKDVHED